MSDTSKIYIKMADCPEIQGQWKPEKSKFNCFYVKSGYYINGAEPGNGEYWIDKGEIAYCGENDGIFGQGECGKYVWLPRQDDFQKMMNLENPVHAIEPFAIYRSYNKWNHLETWEQLWLAFYMNEKHNKVWNGEEWIKA